MNNILETKQLHFSYGSRPVLNGIDLKIQEGSIYGYLGKNGSGKTTTIKLLLGLQTTPSNTVYYKGKELNTNRSEILSNIGKLIELPAYYADLSGYENLKYLDFIFRKGEKRINEVLELTGLKNAGTKKVKHYSTGMKQRLGIAKAIFHQPEFLILDEPFNGLDPEGIYQMRELMIQLKNEGKTIFFSSHILGDVEKICTHLGVLDNGKLLFQGDIKDFTANTSLESAFLNLTAKNHV
jgi:ABC-2 type transport system ATP-binding protein